MASLGPFSVNYPVLFRSGGDTTRIAFGKHIQEIERIYGILNALDSDKLSGSDLDGKLKNFKPSISFNDISGNLDFSRINGSIDGSRITGRIDASKVYGKLSSANIDAGNVNGLQALVKSLIPSNGDGITEVDPDDNGYALFNNGFMIQWGKADYPGSDTVAQKVSFPKSFPNACISIFTSASTNGLLAMGTDELHDDSNVVTVKPIEKRTTRSEFYCGWNVYTTYGTSFTSYLKMRFLAVGY